MKAVATTLATSSVSSDTDDLTESVLEKVAELPELDLHSERKKFLDIVQKECRGELSNLVSNLCQAAFVDMQSTYFRCSG